MEKIYTILGIFYLIGIPFTVAISEILPEDLKDKGGKLVHRLTMVIIWIMSPVLIMYIIVTLMKLKRKK